MVIHNRNNSTGYEHPQESNLLNVHKAMKYNSSGEPVVRTTVDSGDITITGPVTISNEVEITNDVGNPIPISGDVTLTGPINITGDVTDLGTTFLTRYVVNKGEANSFTPEELNILQLERDNLGAIVLSLVAIADTPNAKVSGNISFIEPLRG